MTAERRVVVSAGAVRARRAPAAGGAAPGTRAAWPEAAGAAPPGPVPLPPWPPSSAFGAVPQRGIADTRALIRAQLRTALGTCAIVAAVLVGLPLLALLPAVARARVHGLPLCWLVLVLGVQPVWVAVSFRQLRRAERAERAVGGR